MILYFWWCFSIVILFVFMFLVVLCDMEYVLFFVVVFIWFVEWVIWFKIDGYCLKYCICVLLNVCFSFGIINCILVGEELCKSVLGCIGFWCCFFLVRKGICMVFCIFIWISCGFWFCFLVFCYRRSRGFVLGFGKCWGGVFVFVCFLKYKF